MVDQDRFDGLARGLATNQLSRRRVLQGLAAGMFVGFTSTFGLGCSKRRKDTASPPEGALVKPLPPGAARVPPLIGCGPAVKKESSCDEIWKKWTKSKAPPPKGAPVKPRLEPVAVETCEDFEKVLRSKGEHGVAGFTRGEVACPEVKKDVDIAFVRIGPESVEPDPQDPTWIKGKKGSCKGSCEAEADAAEEDAARDRKKESCEADDAARDNLSRIDQAQAKKGRYFLPPYAIYNRHRFRLETNKRATGTGWPLRHDVRSLQEGNDRSRRAASCRP